MVSAATDSRPRLGGDTLRPDIKANEFDRVLTVFGILAGHLGSFAVLYFWLTGAILLFTGNGGQLVEIVDLGECHLIPPSLFTIIRGVYTAARECGGRAVD